MSTRDFQALRDLLVTRLAARLGVPVQEIDPRESFSRYGLDSAGATGLVAELEADLGRPLSPTLIWAYPTAEELARHLAGGWTGNSSTGSIGARPGRRRSARRDEPIAIVGMSCRYPGGADDPRAFWNRLLEGFDAIREIPRERWDIDAYYNPDPQAPGTINTRRGAFLGRIDQFDPLFFGISPREAAEMDPQQRIALELTWEALEDAGIPPRSLAGTKAGVFLGVIWRDYGDLHREARAVATSHTGAGQALNIVANRISYALGLRGPSLVMDTACSSSLVAVHLACQSLWNGESTVALAGGINLMLAAEIMVALTKFGGLSGDGRCKAFDASADGFARGEGAGLVVLKPLSRALADGDPIYCVIRGSAVNNDGASNGLTAPNPQAQEEVLREAYERAGVDPGQIDYVEAHGTGTPLGDPIEARALSAVLCEDRPADRPLVVGSVKTNIGHLEGAAGIAGLMKLALALHHREIPPSLHFLNPNPHIPFEELRLKVPTVAQPWPSEGRPGLAGVSSFGWGGTNCHMVLEEWPEPFSVEAGRVSLSRDAGEGRGGGLTSPKIAFLFGPLGSQWLGMGRDLLREPAFRAAVERCDRALRPLVSWSALEEIAAGPDGASTEDPEIVQPLLFVVQVALAALWRSRGVEPDAIAGHSLGEIAAAHVAGVLSLEDAARVVVEYRGAQRRARLEFGMRGGMALFNLSPEDLKSRMAPYGDRVEMTGFNSPVTTTLSGDPEALDAILAACKADGIFCARVEVDAAVHSAQMEPVLAGFREAIAGIQPRRPRVPLVSTVTGAPFEGLLDAEYWSRNLRRTIHFDQALAWLLDRGYELLVEVDPHPVLPTVLEQVLATWGPQAKTRLLPSSKRGEAGLPVLLGSLAVLAESGLDRSSESPERVELLPLSARVPEALRDLARLTATRLLEPGSAPLQDLAYTAALRRTHHEYRLTLAGRSKAELSERLEAFAKGEPVAGAATGRKARSDRPRLVFAFSGQGPQWHGMGRQLFAEEPVYREALERCDELLRPHLGFSLLARLAEEEEALDHTEVAQPALFALQVGLVELWRSWGMEPDAVVGHSVGEIAAAWAAGVFTLEEAARVVALRGRTMEPAKGRGKMAAVELPAEEAAAALVGFEDRVCLAAVNSPAATVLAGDPIALEQVLERLQGQGATCRMLHVEYAFHSPQMEPYDRDLEAALADLRPQTARIPMASTVLGGLATGPELDAGYWRRNVREPVRFAEAVSALAREGYSAFLEVGPHPVLAVAVTQTLEAQGRPSEEVPVFASLRRKRDERETMLEAFGGLYSLGYPVDWHGLFPEGGRLADLPTYPFQRQRYWFEAGPRPEARIPAPVILQEAPAPQALAIASTLPVQEGELLAADLADPGIESVLAGQIDAFSRLITLQLDLLRESE